MTEGYLTSTTSTCAQCGKLLPAQIHLRAGAVWFVKHCPQHGRQEERIYGDAQAYLALPHYHRAGQVPLKFSNDGAEGCPASCGICANHEQHICMPIVEITDHCDMACPVCLVKTPGTFHLTVEQVNGILDRLLGAEGQIDILNLSGGEPTVHPAFREIVEACLAREKILYVSISTNGKRLARDPALVRFLAERGAIVSLQYDGQDARSCQTMRGGDWVDQRRRLIDAIGAAGGRMSLTVTAMRGQNEDQLGGILENLFNQDHVISVMIQPLAYIGQAAQIPRPTDALTIPDILRLINGACAGLVSAEDFCPLPCSHPACFSLAFYLRTGVRDYVPLRKLFDADRYLDVLQNRAMLGTDGETYDQIRAAIYDLWSGPAGMAPDSSKALGAVRELLNRIQTAGMCNCRAGVAAASGLLKSIFIHHFMDRHTFDLSRARKCCQVYPLADGRIMPACVYNCLRR
jgi:7,8-dihydro-6-hydroxymethylpterin dimethyltransferase